jgi:Flp pilus assembly protein TadG
MVALLAFASLAVDIGHVFVVRSELRLAADAAARFGVTGLKSGVATAQAYAVDAADDNKSDGEPVTLDPANDIEFGLWNKQTRTYTALSGAARSGANALRVTARRTAANGSPVSLLFARVLGKTSHDVEASAVAYIEPNEPAGIIGYNGVRLNNNAFIAGYNSATTRTPTQSTATTAGIIASNGAISGGTNNTLRGTILLGPSAPSVVGIGVSGSTTYLTTPLVPPADPVWNPVVNPGGVPQNYTASGNVVLPGGTYTFTSLTVNGTLSFSGPATVTVNGPIMVGGSLLAYDLVPANLRIYQINNNDFGDGTANGMKLVADVIAPTSDFLVKNNLDFFGRLVVNSIEIWNNADIYYDVALGTSTGTGPVIVTVR